MIYYKLFALVAQRLKYPYFQGKEYIKRLHILPSSVATIMRSLRVELKLSKRDKMFREVNSHESVTQEV